MSRARRRQSKPDRLLHLGEAIDRMPDVVRMYDDDPSSDPDPARLRDGMKRIGLYLESATGSKLSQGEVMASMDAAGVGVGARKRWGISRLVSRSIQLHAGSALNATVCSMQIGLMI